MKSLPKISIVIPSYNKGEFIGHTLESIVSQNYPNLEVIIQDGGSTDGSIKIIKKYALKYNWISCESKKDKGQVDAINKGLKKAFGEIMTYLNADDIYQKGALKKIGEYFFKHPKTLWLAGKGETIDEQGKPVAEIVDRYKNHLLSLNNNHWLLMVNYLFQPSVFISKKAYETYGPFLGDKTVMEYELWLKLAKIEMPKIIEESLSGFRLIKGSVSTTQFKKLLVEDENIAARYTDNQIILMLHYLHNVGRVISLNLLGIQ